MVHRGRQFRTLLAASKGRVYTISAILNDNVTGVNYKDKWGQTALHLAAAEDRLESVEELLRKGANITAIDNNQRTALQSAQIEGNLEIGEMVEALRKKSELVN